MLFEQSPAAVLEEDWSEAIAYVRSEYSGKSSRIRQFLLAYPTVVRRASAVETTPSAVTVMAGSWPAAVDSE